MQSQIVATGIAFGEGPVWNGGDELVVTSVPGGTLHRVDVASGRVSRFADVGGGANGAARCSDGSMLVTNNGGIDLSFLPGMEDVPFREGPPALQRARPDGGVEVLAAFDHEGEPLHGPNDLVVAADGTVYFTDPGHYPPPRSGFGRVFTYSPDGTVRLVAGGFDYCNGIALDPDGMTLVVVEGRGLQRVHPDGSREWVVEVLGRGGGDGFCLDADGRYYVASTVEHGIRIVEPDGAVADFLAISGDGLCTNCCFGGDDGRTLFVTDAMPGNVVAFESMPSPGLTLHDFPS
jgi:gluconolactonase